MQNDTRIGVDIAKAIFEVAVSDPGQVVRAVRLRRGQFLEFFGIAEQIIYVAPGSEHRDGFCRYREVLAYLGEECGGRWN